MDLKVATASRYLFPALMLLAVGTAGCDTPSGYACPSRPVISWHANNVTVVTPTDSSAYTFDSGENNFEQTDSLRLTDAIRHGNNLHSGIRVSTSATSPSNGDSVTIVLEIPTPLVTGGYAADSAPDLASSSLSSLRPRWSLVDNPTPGHVRLGLRDVRGTQRTFIATSAMGMIEITTITDGYELTFVNTAITDANGATVRLRGKAELKFSMLPGLCVE